MKIVYIGGMPGGHQPDGGKVIDFVRGEPIEVSDKLGKELLTRPDWKAADQKKESK